MTALFEGSPRALLWPSCSSPLPAHPHLFLSAILIHFCSTSLLRLPWLLSSGRRPHRWPNPRALLKQAASPLTETRCCTAVVSRSLLQISVKKTYGGAREAEGALWLRKRGRNERHSFFFSFFREVERPAPSYFSLSCAPSVALARIAGLLCDL